MPHASNIVYCDGPDSPHAFDIVRLQPREGSLDAMCLVCQGRGQWNTRLILLALVASALHTIGATVRDGLKPAPTRSDCLTSSFAGRVSPLDNPLRTQRHGGGGRPGPVIRSGA